MQSFSRQAQDHFLFENFFRGRRGGVFVDVGAGDGERDSNSLFFERFLGWNGLCVEPESERFAQLAARRRCACEQVSLLDGGLWSLLPKHALSHINYCSIDARAAHAELLAPLDTTRIAIDVFTIDRAFADESIARLLDERGYELTARLDQCGVFKRRSARQLARTSVICAVWHGDAERERLLEGHAENLARQTVPVEPVYVFDDRDPPPSWLSGHKAVVHQPLSIYQAWNVALALVDTPLVMNLNLDDRLAPDAVQRLEAVLLAEGAALAAGDWNICYSQQQTDAVGPCAPATEVPFVSAWPPPTGTRTRLGSGTGERLTLGPATLWRMDTHIGAPRYPWRLPDGTVLRVIGDLSWWTLVTQVLKKKMVRLPQIIGNYHSHPSTQAEFRSGPDETELMQSLGISLL